MTESIKQEIINNIFENGDKLITGPILQTVLIDMIDDVNVKDQAILSKTGSWDDAVTQIPNLATKEEVTNLSESVARDLTGYATETWVESQGYLKEHQDISNLATKGELTEAKNNLQGNITSLSESVARDLTNVDVDLTGYATETWVESQGYLKEHQDISGLATKTELNDAKNNLQGNITSLSESVARDLANVSVPEGVATEAWVQSQDYASKSYVDNAVSSSSVDLTGYATEQWVQNQGYLTEHQDISNLTTKAELTSVSESVQTDISNLATKGELNSVSESIQTNITSLSESVANSAVWKKGEGESSIVQKLTGNNETNTPTATKLGAVAIGTATNASGKYSHAEGDHTVASGWGSHAEGHYTSASGENSHAEGNQTTASGNFGSHAEGFRTVASGIASHAEGSWTNASGKYSHAEGESTDASGDNSHAEGSNTLASGSHSHAEGSSTNASGSYSHAEGFWTQAIGQASHAEGDHTKALGEYSHAEGSSTNASGSYSHAEGFNTITSNQYEHAQGRYNYTSSNQIFSIGTGNSNTDRRNAVSVLEVSNNNSYTSSFFVQNVGGYDGTNPTPGTNDLATVINNLPSGGGSSETLWKKGEGQDSLVQVLTGDDEAYTSTATGKRAIAVGFHATASGDNSYAEGNSTASGSYSHAEGHGTLASGIASHAEGYYTTASNTSEHAQGRFNHSSENQIFSVGAGEWGDISNVQGNRRNAISVLAVPNADTKINTASFFVQNIGGYDGTNPEPGTNDLATVINNLSSSGGSSSGGSSETLWKKGTAQDSIVQAIADGTNLPTATGERAIATGYSTEATGKYSHAEGDNVRASGYSSHAEGYWTRASGQASHAEGYNTKALTHYSHAEGDYTLASGESSHAEGHYTSASNNYEHAQGRFNHNSENQIFSIGTGNSNTDRRNAVSVLEVDNSGSYTSSFFVQNVGGYDGTNPTPGTNDLATVINGMSTGGGSSETLWKKGTGTDSIVQILSGDNEAKTPIASGTGSIAIGHETEASGSWSHAEGRYTKALDYASHAEGFNTKASGEASHAEGSLTIASGKDSHAEGNHTTASGKWSHAEGLYTNTSNAYEHAQGTYNHNSENQIFSIGAGEIVGTTVTRRNAISVLAVPNRMVLTSSVFVQNIGGYDGTNPEPGTNDLATVLNNTETWTFTLEDGSTVTKTIRIS